MAGLQALLIFILFGKYFRQDDNDEDDDGCDGENTQHADSYDPERTEKCIHIYSSFLLKIQ